MLKLLTMSMAIFDKTLETIDEHNSFSLSPKLILALLIVTGVCLLLLEYYLYGIKKLFLLRPR